MSLAKTLSNPAVEIDNKAILIKPNSLTYKLGKGDKNIRAQSAGGSTIEMVVSENAETKKSMVKFTMFNTKSNIDSFKAWQDKIAGIGITLSEGSFSESFNDMILITDPEITLGAEGEFEINFEGSPSS